MTSTEQPPPTRIDTFELRIRLDATLTVNGDQWIKPGTEGAITWRGQEWNGQWIDPLPSEDELIAAYKRIEAGMVAPILEEIIALSQRRLTEKRQGR